MALQRKHSVTITVDSANLIAIDTTPIQDYIDEIGSPVTNEATLLSNTTAISLELVDNTTSTTITADITAEKANLRTANGATLSLSTYFGVDTIDDDLYDITMTWTIDGDDYDSTTDKFFYPVVTNEVAKAVVSGDWKDAFNYRSNSTYSKYALKLKSWLDQLELADKNGLLTQGLSILNSLKSIL